MVRGYTMEGLNYIVSSVSDTHYTGALVQNQAEEEEFPGLRGDGKGCIKAIIIKSRENLAWQLELWDADDNILDRVLFDPAEATEQLISGTTWFFYATPVQNAMPFKWAIPLTVPKETVTVALRNMSAATKTAGDDGAVIVRLRIHK
jgi:hypothetical protein